MNGRFFAPACTSDRGGQLPDRDSAGDDDDALDDERLDDYLARAARFRPLSAAEEVELAKAREEGDREARRRLIDSNRGLVVSLARGYESPEFRLARLIRAGNDGLARAVDRYDWRKGFRFSTYATWWIRQAIVRAMAARPPAQGPTHDPG